MKLDERKEHMLDFIVRDFIRTAEPVSSGRMATKKVLNASPATLRNLMLELDESGYLFQPHTSAGRAPTDRGYRYFVDNLMDANDAAREQAGFDSLENIADDFAKELNVFVGAMVRGKKFSLEQAGFKNMLGEPEFRDTNMLQCFGNIVDEIENIMEEYRQELLSHSKRVYNIWIGNENPHKSAKKGSIVMANVPIDRHSEMMIFVFGPKRMNYEKAVFKIKSLFNEI